MKKSIGINTIFNVAYKLLNIIFPLITSAYLARILGPSYIGKVDYSRNIMSYFLVVASMGIPTYGMREIAKARNDANKKNRIFTELIVLNGLFSTICSIAYTICIFFVDKFHANYKLYLCTGITLFMNIINVDWVYSGDEEYVYMSTRSFIVKIISIACIFLFVQNQSDYIFYALITSLATTGNYILNVINLKKHVRLIFSNLSFRRHFKPIIILFVTLLASDLYNQIDITMLGFHYDDAVIGYYSNGVKLIRIVYSITIAVGSTIMPRMCLYYKEKSNIEYSNLFWKTFWVVILCAFPSSIGLFMVADDTVSVLFGNQFLPTITVIKILTPIIIIISVSYLIGSVVLTSTNNEKYLLCATLLGAITNIVLNVILIPRFSTTGAAIASLIGEFIVLMVHFTYGRKYVNGLINFKELVKIFLSLGVMIIFVLGARILCSSTFIRLILSIFMGFLGYVITLIITRSEITIYILHKIISKAQVWKIEK